MAALKRSQPNDHIFHRELSNDTNFMLFLKAFRVESEDYKCKTSLQQWFECEWVECIEMWADCWLADVAQ